MRVKTIIAVVVIVLAALMMTGCSRDNPEISSVVSEPNLEVDESPYYTSENEDGTLSFGWYRGTYPNSKFSIPSEIGGKVISEISPYAFDGERNITKVMIPKTVTKIGKHAF